MASSIDRDFEDGPEAPTRIGDGADEDSAECIDDSDGGRSARHALDA
jgi:hypothetical protein